MNPNPGYLLINDSRAATAEEAAVLRAMHALSQACLSASPAELAALVQPALTYSHSDGRIQTRDAFIAALVNGQSVFRSIELQGVSVQLAGDTALVRHQALYATFNRGEPGLSDVQVSQVWQRSSGGDWCLLLRQARKTPSAL